MHPFLSHVADCFWLELFEVARRSRSPFPKRSVGRAGRMAARGGLIGEASLRHWAEAGRKDVYVG